MSKVITFSTAFPKYHPKAGQPTYFVERLHKSLDGYREIERLAVTPDLMPFFNFAEYGICDPKHHTIRSGNRWKVGDKFSPRFWSGIPYQSKQIIIAPDIEVKKVWSVEIAQGLEGININGDWTFESYYSLLQLMAFNDGLNREDFQNWFNKTSFIGQIICWNSKIKY